MNQHNPIIKYLDSFYHKTQINQEDKKIRRKKMKNLKFILFAIVILIAAADMESTTLFTIKSIVGFLTLLAVAVLKAKEWEEE